MPSPFPGMDPFIQLHEWGDFHANFITEIQAQLAPRLAPRYYIRVERRVYFERSVPDEREIAKQPQRVPDVAILKTGESELHKSSAGTATLAMPRECVVPAGEEHREYFLLIRGTESHEVVTVLELLSPTNKRPGADGRNIYLEKRQQILDGLSHFVELDLLRGGHRLPVQTKSPLGNDYYALVSRRQRRPRADIYQWSLRESMPSISIPLEKGDPDVALDLQATFSATYERVRYDLSINYLAPLVPPPSEEEQQVLRDVFVGKEARPASS
jgi:hypothetical protein